MDMRVALLNILRTERRFTRDTIVALKDGEISFRPTGEQMNFAEQALHIVANQEMLMRAFRGEPWDWRPLAQEALPTHAAILHRFDDCHAAELAFYQDMDPQALEQILSTPWGTKESAFQLAITFLAHEAHHRGQLAVYLRLKGFTPPAY